MQYNGDYRMRIYEGADMEGQMIELTDDCPNIMDRFHTSDIQSCHVMDGHWLLHEQPNYRGQMYYLGPGEYKKYSEWGGTGPRIGSLRRITI